MLRKYLQTYKDTVQYHSNLINGTFLTALPIPKGWPTFYQTSPMRPKFIWTNQYFRPHFWQSHFSTGSYCLSCEAILLLGLDDKLVVNWHQAQGVDAFICSAYLKGVTNIDIDSLSHQTEFLRTNQTVLFCILGLLSGSPFSSLSPGDTTKHKGWMPFSLCSACRKRLANITADSLSLTRQNSLWNNQTVHFSISGLLPGTPVLHYHQGIQPGTRDGRLFHL